MRITRKLYSRVTHRLFRKCSLFVSHHFKDRRAVRIGLLFHICDLRRSVTADYDSLLIGTILVNVEGTPYFTCLGTKGSATKVVNGVSCDGLVKRL